MTTSATWIAEQVLHKNSARMWRHQGDELGAYQVLMEVEVPDTAEAWEVLESLIGTQYVHDPYVLRSVAGVKVCWWTDESKENFEADMARGLGYSGA